MSSENCEYIEQIPSDQLDSYADESVGHLLSWSADLSFSELWNQYHIQDTNRPEMQHLFVWTELEASKFIDSILLGLPLPSIVLARCGSQMLIIDGFQRIMTVRDYMQGVSAFVKPGSVFKLADSPQINAKWRNKAFTELTPHDQHKIKSAMAHSIIVEQSLRGSSSQGQDQSGNLVSAEDTGFYHLFERLHSGGREQSPQEIRNRIYPGSFNSMLFALNQDAAWRKLIGGETLDPKLRDLECILRFFALKDLVVKGSQASPECNVGTSEGNAQTQAAQAALAVQAAKTANTTNTANTAKACAAKPISLTKALNVFMRAHQNDDALAINNFQEEFHRTVQQIYSALGENAFRNSNRNSYNEHHEFSQQVHPAICGAMMTAVCLAGQKGLVLRAVPETEHLKLFNHAEFDEAFSKTVLDLGGMRTRVNMIAQVLFGVDVL